MEMWGERRRKWHRTPLLPWLERLPWSAQGHGQEVKWEPNPEVLRGHDMSPETQGERGINSPPVPQTRPGLQWAQRCRRPAGRLLWGRRGGKPHRSICPPCGATGRPAPREQLAGCRGLCRAGAGGRRPCRTAWSTDRQHAASPLLTSRPVAEETQARAPVLSLAQALRQGTTPAFLLGIPRDRGLWAGLPLCSGLQLFLPFLNGSGPAGGVRNTRQAPTTPRTWISTLESLPFSWF